MSKKTVIARTGATIKVDTSDEACGKFGFKHGERIINHNGDKGIIAGVAPATEGRSPEPEVLWYTLENSGKAIYTYPIEDGDIKRI